MTKDETFAWLQREAELQYDENGVDLSHLRENLRLTPAERMQKHEAARRFVRELHHATQRRAD